MLNRHNFEIAELAPKDEERLIYCGILVTPGGTSVTDGHLAALVTAVEQTQPLLFPEMQDVVPAEEFTPFVLDRESALRIAKSVPKSSDTENAVYPIIDASTENSERAMVSINDVFRQEIIRARKIEGKFPDICKVIPDKATAKVTIRLNPALMLDALKALNKFCKGREVGTLELTTYGTGAPVRMDADGMGQVMTVVVMPQRSEATEEPGD